MSQVHPTGLPKSSNFLDYENRDPNTIFPLSHFEVDFSDVFAEPDPGVHSFNGAWKASYLTFSYVRLWTYRILSIFGVITTCCYGFQYGCTSCYTIWCCWPLLKLLEIMCIPPKRLLNLINETCLLPFIQALSMIFWNVRVKMSKPDA